MAYNLSYHFFSLLMYWYNISMLKKTWKLNFFKTVIELFTYEISENVSIWFNNFSRHITLLGSLFYIQCFDKFNNFIWTSISSGKICIKTFAFYICNTRVILKISERFFEWIICAMKILIWNIRNFKLINFFREKILKTWHSSSSFEIVLFPSVKFIFSPF